MLGAMGEIVRLSAVDQANLIVEAPDAPMHEAALGVLDGASLLDADGHVRIDQVRAHVEARLDRIPELRRVLFRRRLLGGPSWVDDPAFRIEDHVLLTRLPEPGGQAQALAFAEQRMAVLMDRSRPLWEVWFLEGFAPDRVGILVKLHHAVADGRAMVNIIGQIFDLEPGAFEKPRASWSASPPPSRRDLLEDDLRRAAGWWRRRVGALAHPIALARSWAGSYRSLMAVARQGGGAPRTSLCRPIGISRRVAVTRVSLDEVKAVAHRQGVKVNDVFLAVVAGGLRQVLFHRGEHVDADGLHASVAVSLHHPGDTTTSGNLVGTMIVPLPVDGGDARARLARIAAACSVAKATQPATVSPRLMVALARSRLIRFYIRRQHFINVMTTNLPGPPVPLYFGGARLLDAAAIPPIAGNVTVSFAALSYDRQLNLSVIADARAWPDFAVLDGAMQSSWLALKQAVLEARPAA
jgi:WS/DGAT/MGAT family acyltransferase